VLAFVGILGAIGWALLGDKLLVVRVITVSGTRLVTPAEVIAAADVPAGTPLIRVDTARVAARVEAITQVASARVSKDWPDGLSITVTERVPVVAVRMAGGGYDLVDHDGVIVIYAKAKPSAMPVFQTALPGSELRGSHDVATASAVLAGLPAWLYHEVTDVAVTGGTTGSAGEAGVPVGSVVLYLTGGQTVAWGGPDLAGVKARELAILMRDHASYYDVTDPETVVTK
jgi:cell division protein FtsQ